MRSLHRKVPPERFALVWLTLLLLFAGALPCAAITRQLNGNAYVSLGEVAKRLGQDFRWVKKGKTAELYSEWTTMRFTIHEQDFTLNGREIGLGNPVASNKGELFTSELDYNKTILPILAPQVYKDSASKLYHIVIDPGHGGKDPGAQNPKLGLYEKNLTLDLAKRLEKRLEALGYKVTLTRTTDKFIPLEDRAAYANRIGADLFLSLHFNAVGTPSVHGIETFAMTPQGQPSSNRVNLTAADKRDYPGNKNDPWNALAAFYIQNEMLKFTGADDRGMKRARFVVLREVNCPAVLIEGGFVTNPTEGRNVGSAAYRDKLANAITAGVLTYQKTLNRVRGK